MLKEPTKVVWNRKCSTLIVCTLIGIYIYMIGTENDKSIVNLVLLVVILDRFRRDTWDLKYLLRFSSSRSLYT